MSLIFVVCLDTCKCCISLCTSWFSMPIKLFVHSFKVSNAEIKVEWVKGEEKLSITRIKWWFRETEEWECEVEWYTRWKEEDQEQNLEKHFLGAGMRRGETVVTLNTDKERWRTRLEQWNLDGDDDRRAMNMLCETKRNCCPVEHGQSETLMAMMIDEQWTCCVRRRETVVPLNTDKERWRTRLEQWNSDDDDDDRQAMNVFCCRQPRCQRVITLCFPHKMHQ